MNHQGTKTIETKRLILRRFTIEDAPDMFRNWASDDEVTRFLLWPTHTSIEVSQGYVQSVIENYRQTDTYDWGIELKEIGQVIGSIGVVSRNESVGSMHIGYCIGKQWWHMGIVSEALSAVINYLFEEVGVNRIDSRHDPRNPNSGKVMGKCGLSYEGTLRESDRNNQGICDASWYALLRKEYEAR